MDGGLKNLKIVLLGVIIIAIPILFIMQSESDSDKTKKIEDYRIENAELETYNSYLMELIKLYGIQINALSQQGNNEQAPNVTINPIINLPETGSQNSGDNKGLKEIATAISNLPSYPNYSKQFDELINAISSLTPSPVDWKKVNEIIEPLSTPTIYPNYNDQLNLLIAILSPTINPKTKQQTPELSSGSFTPLPQNAKDLTTATNPTISPSEFNKNAAIDSLEMYLLKYHLSRVSLKRGIMTRPDRVYLELQRELQLISQIINFLEELKRKP